MFNRRAIFHLCAKAVITGAGSLGLTASPLLLAVIRTNAADRPRTSDTFEEQLEAEMTRLADRVYSEQGIPMILACENLVPRPSMSSSSKATSAEFAPVFQRVVNVWERLRPAAPAADVASLVELLADRDFASGGRSAGL